MRNLIRKVLARSRFDDLGDSRRCGPELVVDRAPEDSKFEVSDQLRRNETLPSALERKVYPASADPDLTITFNHKMKLKDDTPWSGKSSFKVSVRYTSHSQQRMDYRCIQNKDVENVVTDLFRKIESAWVSKDYRLYGQLFKHFEAGSGRDKIKATSDGDRLLFVLGPVNVPTHSDLVSTRRGDMTVKVPSSSHILVNLVSIMGGNRSRVTQEDLEKARCKQFLEDRGYTLTRKGSKIARRFIPSVTLMQPDGSMLRSDGSGWVGPLNMGLTIEMTMDENEVTEILGLEGESDKKKAIAQILRPALSSKFKSEIYDKWDNKDFNAYNRNLRSIFEGFQIEQDGVTFDFESAAVRDLGTIEDYGQELLIPHVMSKKPYLFFKVQVRSDLDKSLKEVKVDREVQECIDALSADYYINK